MQTAAPRRTLSLSLVALFALHAACSQAPHGPAVSSPTRAAFEPQREPVFEAEAIGPLANPTALQIVSVFSYDAGEQLISPATEIAGFVADARMNHNYGKEPLQPLVVTPTPTSIKARQLLVIAWGPRSEFSTRRANEVGHAAMREALKLGVEEMAYAPIARDQGVTSLDADVVAAAFVEGALDEFISEEKTAAPGALHLKHVTYEAGPAFVAAVSKATARGVEAAHAHAN